MRLHPAQLGEWRSVGIFTLEQPLDLMAITVLFGANGSGKTNILEGIAELLDRIAKPEGLREAIRVDRSMPKEDHYPGYLVFEFDRWRENGHPDQQIVWALLTSDRAPELLLDNGSSVPDSIHDYLRNTCGGAPGACPSSSALAGLMGLWAEVMASSGTIGDHDARRTLAFAMLSQGLLEMPDGLPKVIPAQLPDDAKQSVIAIDALGAESQWDDPIWDAARSLRDGLTSGTAPWPMRESYGLSSYSRIGPDVVDALAELLRDVWVVDGEIEGLHDEISSTIESLGLTSQGLTSAVARLADEANRLLPSFIAGRIVVELPPHDEVRVALQEQDGAVWGIDVLGRGVARWTAIALRCAARRLRTPRPPAGALFPGILLIDEPEAHLHPGAVRSVARWLVERNREGVGVVIATHEVEFLDLPSETAEFVLVRKKPGEWSRAEPIGDNLLGALETHAAELGLTRGQIMLRTKGVLILEGIHDVHVVRYYYDRELNAQRMLVLPLHGLHEAMSLVELEFLSRLDVPIVLLCDNARKELLDKAILPRNATEEEKKIFKLMLHLKDYPKLKLTSHGLVDIVCALPEDAVAAVVNRTSGSQFRGWADTLRAAKTNRLKDYMRDQLGVIIDARFIDAVLHEGGPDSPPAASLHRAMKAALAFAADHY